VTGDCSYVTEQAMREIYLKPFEIAVKEGHTHGVMSSFNRIGTRWTGGDYRLLTTILREEWGFNGAVLCDFNTIPDYMNSKQMAYAGGDLNLATLPVTFVDESSTGDVYVLRRALKDVAYAVGNSNAMKGDVVGHTLAPWQILIIGVDCGVGGALLLWGGLEIVLIHHKEKAKDSVVPHGA
jgi:beta-glucosidase